MEEKDKIKLYIKQREEFKFFKSVLESRVYFFPISEKGIKSILNQKRPITEQGELICAPCDMVSMVPVDKKYGPNHGFSYTHECEVCGGNELGKYL